MAHLITGLPPFLDFIPLNWTLLGGHILFELTVAYVVAWREVHARAGETATA